MPYYPAPHLAFLGIKAIDLNIFRRSGYLCVDLVILLSGFLLFLPYAKQKVTGSLVDSVGLFYCKRFARILPSYLFAVLSMFLISFLNGAYDGKTSFMWRDLLMHLSLTFMLRPDTYLFSGINGVFWTVAVEMMFYAVFPLIAKCFQKRPLITYICMTGIGLSFIYGICIRQTNNISFYVNRFLTFLPVFANGMAGAYVYVVFLNKIKHKWIFSLMGTALACVALYILVLLFKSCSSSKQIQVWQLTWRYPLSVTFLFLVVGMCVSPKPLRFLLSNRVLSSIAAVSYNLYLWHQFIIVRIRIGMNCKSGADVAALGANSQWMLNMEALVLSFAIAILITYLLEKPSQTLILQYYHRIQNRTISTTE